MQEICKLERCSFYSTFYKIHTIIYKKYNKNLLLYLDVGNNNLEDIRNFAEFCL